MKARTALFAVIVTEAWYKYLPFKRTLQSHAKTLMLIFMFFYFYFLTVTEFCSLFPRPLPLPLDKPTEYCFEECFISCQRGVCRVDTSGWLIQLHHEYLGLEKWMWEEGDGVGNECLLPKVLTGLLQMVELKIEQRQHISPKVHHLKHTT